VTPAPAVAAPPPSATPGAADGWLARAGWQRTLFAPEPRRLDLLRLEPSWPCTPFRLRVHRNQAFEFVASVLPPFLAYAGRAAATSLGGYDDSLALPTDGPADVELVWLDLGRYRARLSPAALAAWLGERVRALRLRTEAPVLVADDPAGDAPARELNDRLRALAAEVPGVRILPMSAIGAELGARTFDPRAAKVTGMPLSDAACLRAARDLGLVHLPAALGPRLKAVVVDLDHTLYAGVLGEDGPSGLRLTPAHAALQRALVALRGEGIFLAIASRNEPADVDRLFAARTDFPLRPEHLSARAVAFRDKAPGIAEAARALRISPDAMVLLDDNPGELAAVTTALPGVRALHAADPELALRALERYPHLHGYPAGRDDARRVADLDAAGARAEAATAAASPAEYLRSLEVVLGFAVNPSALVPRLAELSGKTNQFNTSLLRLGEAQVARRLADPACRTIAVSLRDRLSDSGVVAALFARRDGATLHVDELVVSCRALGRSVELPLVLEALRLALAELPAPEIVFAFRPGPRNDPARRFLAELCGREPGASGATLPWDPAGAARALERLPVTLVREDLR
jgi:FkbH-like protein